GQTAVDVWQRGLERRRAQGDGGGAVGAILLRLRIGDAGAGYPVLFAGVDEALHATGRPQRQAARRARGGQRGVDAAEIRPRDASAVARSAVVAGRTTVVWGRQVGDATDCEHAVAPKPLLHPLPDMLLGAVQRHRREELALP